MRKETKIENQGHGLMKRAAALVQIIVVLGIIIYGTYNLFIGKFEQSALTIPLLVAFYFLVAAGRKKNEDPGSGR